MSHSRHEIEVMVVAPLLVTRRCETNGKIISVKQQVSPQGYIVGRDRLNGVPCIGGHVATPLAQL